MRKQILASVMLATISACGGGKAPDASDAPAISGAAAYQAACADCHDSGKDGAPRTNHPEDWQGRSALWQSVLVEHAKSGYLDMPARGGDASLPDATVAAAAEYMLEITHGNRPPDD